MIRRNHTANLLQRVEMSGMIQNPAFNNAANLDDDDDQDEKL